MVPIARWCHPLFKSVFGFEQLVTVIEIEVLTYWLHNEAYSLAVSFELVRCASWRQPMVQLRNTREKPAKSPLRVP